MSTLRTYNLKSIDSGSVNIQLTPNAGAILAGLTTAQSGLNVTGGTILSGLTTAQSGFHVTNGNVGIGTDNPLNLLDILQNTGRTRINRLGHIISQNHNHGTTNYWAFAPRNNGKLDIAYGAPNDGGTITGEIITIDVDGNVGIGTDNPQEKLHIHEGDVVIGQTSGANTGITNYIKFGRADAPKAAIGFRNNKSNGRGDIIIFNDNDNNASAFDDSDERLRITADGKIGIGNTLPLYAMHFKNEMSATPSYIHMEVTGTNTVGGGGGIAFDTSASNNASNNSLYLATIRGERTSADNGSNNLVFSTSRSGVAGDDGNTHSPAERLRIGSNGELGLSGANYGTAGQVIKSNGSGAAPTWSNLYSYYFYGEQDSQQGSWPNATYKKIQNLGNYAVNVGSSSIATWNESGGALTIGADGAGHWFLSMGGGIDDIQNADYVQVVIGKNGGTTSVGTRVSTYSRGYSSAGNHIPNAQVSCITNLSVGDVVRFYLYHNEGTSDEHSEPSRCFAMGYKL